MTSTAPAIRTEGLTKDYGEGRGVFDLDLEVDRGEILGFIGPNGAGKSTTMRMLLGLIAPTRGDATMLGLSLQDEGIELRRRVGYLPGDLELYPRLTGAEVLEYLATLRGGVGRAVRDSLVERFDAELHRPIGDLSSGNRQKIGLVQALMHEPELLVLDEPITGLDPLVQQSFHTLLREIREQGRTVFLSSHTLSEVERVADRVAVLRGGRLVVVDSLESLRKVAVQRLDVDFAQEPPVEALRVVDGVRKIESHGHGVQISFEGPADALVKALAQHEVLAIRGREDDLEQIFLRFYRDEEE